ncbi:hypothetical protein [Victivallis lenta]|uniref:hypothetical protein n=1 Tax=Victivallis lenta TaxID=2606640 RepID=UPI000D0346D9|nr:hypothetical protein [uncultured Victivallis sp.]AVM45713.1 hypothetical protein C5Q97_13795 [Victivallales bacterium CCUG 44730]
MNKSLKVMLLAGVLAAGAFGAEARDRGPGDGVQITRAIVGGIVQVLSPRPCRPMPPPPPPNWCPPPPPRHHCRRPRFDRPPQPAVIERTVIIERPHGGRR